PRCTISSCPAPAYPPTYTPSLHDALPISVDVHHVPGDERSTVGQQERREVRQLPVLADPAEGHPLLEHLRDLRRRHQAAPSALGDRKSTRLNSSHVQISYAVLCLKKKNKT